MRRICVLVFLVAAVCGELAIAQDYPLRPVRIIVTFPAGGAADIVARVFGARLSEMWKHQVIVENRVGGGGSVGTEAVYRANPDGYTLLLATTTHIINHVLLTKLSFNFTKDFHALAVVTAAPAIIAVHPSVPANNLRQLTAMLKAAPGKYDYTACNMASPFHFAMEMYKYELGIDALHISHRGCAPAAADTVAGQIKILVTNAPSILPFVKQGRLKPIALLSRDRSPSVPDVPTARESGIPELKDFYLESYYGFMAPLGTPAPVLAKLEADVLSVAAQPEARKKLEGAGMDMLVLDSMAMMKQIHADAEKYARVAKLAGIKSE